MWLSSVEFLLLLLLMGGNRLGGAPPVKRRRERERKSSPLFLGGTAFLPLLWVELLFASLLVGWCRYSSFPISWGAASRLPPLG